MKITWVTPDRIQQHKGQITSDRVDIRLRCIGPGAELSKRKHDVQVVSALDWSRWPNNPSLYQRDVFILGKPFVDVRPMIPRIHANQSRFVIDVCDNVFEPPEDGLKEIYQELFPFADGIVTSSERLQIVLAEQIGRPDLPMQWIPDSVEGERLPPRFTPRSGVLRLLWFGYPNNLPLMQASLPALEQLSSEMNVELALVTSWRDHRRGLFENSSSSLNLRLLDWSLEVMATELAYCDLVIIPSNNDPARLTKSPNRLITCLWAGRYAVAWPIPSYTDFAGFAGIGEDLVGNIRWALQHPGEVVARITAGQEHVANRYSGDRIGNEWETFLRSLLS